MSDYIKDYDGAEVIEKPQSTLNNMMVSRQAQEVQAAMVIAKKFPRDETLAFSKIMQSCKRKGLAEQSEYTYPRGGQKVNGPSIRLAESMAQNWGNIDYGILELNQREGESEMMAYAWDLETNTRVSKIFSVKHKRDTKKGSYNLEDSRDIYEVTANFGARRVRACILGIIPGDVIDAAVEECRKTLKSAYKEPLQDRIRRMIAEFEANFSVTKELIEEYCGYKTDSFNEQDFVKLSGVFRSLRDGMANREDYFKFKPDVEDPFKDKKTNNKKDVKEDVDK